MLCIIGPETIAPGTAAASSYSLAPPECHKADCVVEVKKLINPKTGQSTYCTTEFPNMRPLLTSRRPRSPRSLRFCLLSDHDRKLFSFDGNECNDFDRDRESSHMDVPATRLTVTKSVLFRARLFSPRSRHPKSYGPPPLRLRRFTHTDITSWRR